MADVGADPGQPGKQAAARDEGGQEPGEDLGGACSVLIQRALQPK